MSRSSIKDNTAPRLLRPWPGIRTSWLIVVTLLAAGALIAPYFDVFLGSVHNLIFPLVLLSFWRIPREDRYRLPTPFVVGAFCLWLAGAWYWQAHVPQGSNSGYVYLARLDGDSDGHWVERLFQRYNQIAATYSLPKMKMVPVELDSAKSRTRWPFDSPDGLMLLTGSAGNLQVHLRGTGLPPGVASDLSNNLFEGSRALDVDLTRASYVIQPQWLTQPLVLARDPQSFALPDMSGNAAVISELGRHLLAWLAAGLDVKKRFERELPNPMEWSWRERNLAAELHSSELDFYFRASEVAGPWSTNGPRATALFYAATEQIRYALMGGEYETGSIDCAIANFKKAAGWVENIFDRDNPTEPRLSAAIFNNVAVAQLLIAESKRDFVRARNWLWRAARRVDRDGEPVEAARMALLNLQALYRSGVL